MNYYYTTGDQSEVLGPVSLDEIKALSLVPPVQVCEEGKSEWQPLESLIPVSKASFIAKRLSLPPPLPKSAKALPKIATTPVELTLPSLPISTKPCPMCGEPILSSAKKCKHCGEYLDGSSRQGAQVVTKIELVGASKQAKEINKNVSGCLVLPILVGVIWIYSQFTHSNNVVSSPPIHEEGKSDVKDHSKGAVSNDPIEGNRVIAESSIGTSFQKEQYEKDNLGQTFNFVGMVQDVVSERAIIVMIDSRNYANVTFLKENVSNYGKGESIQFTAKIAEFGTGILIKHDLTDAELIR